MARTLPANLRTNGWGADGRVKPGHDGTKEFALRLGLRQIRGFSEDDAKALVAARARPYRTPGELVRRGGQKRGAMERLAAADAFRSLGLDRRAAEATLVEG